MEKMTSYRQIIYHIVFRTKNSKRTLNQEFCSNLYKYVYGIIKNKKGHLYRINGIEDHIHILSDLNPQTALSDYIRDIKTASSKWLRESPFFPHWQGWAEGYAAFTYSYNDKGSLIEYVKNQKVHHRKERLEDELKRLFKEHGIVYDPRFF